MSLDAQHDLAFRMGELARTMAVPLSVDQVLTGVTSAAVEFLPGAATAGVLLIGRGGSFESHAVTDPLMYRLDTLQHDLEEGPCITAALDELIVRVDDFTQETRWPKYSAAVTDLGIRSSLSFKLYTSQRAAGALNVFGTEPHAFDYQSEAIGSVLAAHAAAAITASRQGEQLESALSTRDLIGQAKGIIMERFKVDAVRAFELLRELSQTSNTKLTDVAQGVVDTRSH
ncbi:GAF and ANTAR domain-containing protein [Mycobacterium sp. MYCO198283]|uniref:GAF and ANTAR domain-containing protein n=1 Tax=Mycobacterium sp. MYCO198283 TaxID=2883505 RepID=UPI001E367427|nr:GAF and ANTAR domain-containing protein [Mycobacterium sp. MYCO198283]MCG5431073.1 GAF and ANTAR domain-containing protein [Mycobacterium sp. MYCO198283]